MISPRQFRLKTHPAIAIILATALCFAATAGARQANPLTIDADGQFGFAESLFRAGDYAQGIGEFRRFIFFFPRDHRVAEALYKIGLSQYEIGRYADAVKTFTEITQRFPASQLSRDAHFKVSESYLKSGAAAQAVITLENYLQTTEDGDIRDEIYYRMGWIFVAGADWPRAEGAFAEISSTNRNMYRLDDLEEILAHAGELPCKNPTTAGVLAILPGVGHLYTGRPRDALISFVINAGLILAAVESFDNDLPVLGGVFTMVGLGFYSGNIYSAVNSAHKFNRTTTRSFIDQLTRGLKVNLGAGPRQNSLALSLEVPF